MNGYLIELVKMFGVYNDWCKVMEVVYWVYCWEYFGYCWSRYYLFFLYFFFFYFFVVCIYFLVSFYFIVCFVELCSWVEGYFGCLLFRINMMFWLKSVSVVNDIYWFCGRYVYMMFLVVFGKCFWFVEVLNVFNVMCVCFIILVLFLFSFVIMYGLWLMIFFFISEWCSLCFVLDFYFFWCFF